MKSDLQKLVEMVRALPLTLESNQTSIQYLTVYYFNAKTIEMPDLDSPYLYLPLDGSMRLHTPSGIMDYLPGQYSLSAIDTPMSGQVLTFSAAGDFLALAIELTLDDVISVILAMEDDLAERIANDQIASQTMEIADNNVISAIAKLCSLLDTPDQLAFMGQHMKREIIFEVLCGSCGKQFLQSIINIQQAGEIYTANSWIKQNFKKPFTVEELAEQRNMSVSSFHQKFQSAVGMGPLQCQKRLRLTEARRMMLDEQATVTDASLEVGYESVSQFIRDYRKMFGLSPKEDILNLRQHLQK